MRQEETAPAAPPRDRYPVPQIEGHVRRSFLPALGIWLVLLALAWPFLTLGFVNHYGAPDGQWIEALYERKDLAVRQSASRPEPRLIVVGGSETLFGVDAELIQRKLGVSTINYGTHAALNSYLLYRVRQALRPGDSVLLCPAYEIWRDYDVSDVEWDYFATYDKRFFWRGGMADGLRTLYSVPGTGYYESLIGWGKRGIGRYQDEKADYDVATMDANGDLRGPIWPKPFRSATAFELPLPQNSDAAADFRDFGQWARNNRVRVFFSWPNCCRPDPLPAESERRTPESVKLTFDQWGFILLNDPRDAWFPKQWFVDTSYHPDAGCRRVRTEALIRRLRPYYGLPPEDSRPSGIYLISSRTTWLNDGNSFDSNSGIQARYISRQRPDSPDAITPEEVAECCKRKTAVYFDDPEIESLFPSDAWLTKEISERRESLADWVRRYGNHLFLLARVSGSRQAGPRLPANVLPGKIQAGLEGDDPLAAVFGTGAWSNIRRIATSPKTAKLRFSLEKLTGPMVPHLSLVLQADHVPAESHIQVNDRSFAASTDGQICVVVIEPNEGVVVDAATFPGGQVKTLWSMKQLLPRDNSTRRWPR